jgi:RNA polymerase subunit RPABC4/transcription elongation factor Spt4
MAQRLLCPSCGRTVYIEEGDTPVCPVCSSPLIETVEAPETEVTPSEDMPD